MHRYIQMEGLQHFYTMLSEAHTWDILREILADVGILAGSLDYRLGRKTDGDKTKFIKQVCCLDIRLTHMEKGRRNQNHWVERRIGLLKSKWKQRMTDKPFASKTTNWFKSQRYCAGHVALMIIDLGTRC